MLQNCQVWLVVTGSADFKSRLIPRSALGRSMRPSNLENSHSRSRISRVFVNESSVWVRGANEGVLGKASKFKVRMRAIDLRILEDSRKLVYELFWQNRAVGMYQILEVHQFI